MGGGAASEIGGADCFASGHGEKPVFASAGSSRAFADLCSETCFARKGVGGVSAA